MNISTLILLQLNTSYNKTRRPINKRKTNKLWYYTHWYEFNYSPKKKNLDLLKGKASGCSIAFSIYTTYIQRWAIYLRERLGINAFRMERKQKKTFSLRFNLFLTFYKGSMSLFLLMESNSIMLYFVKWILLFF